MGKSILLFVLGVGIVVVLLYLWISLIAFLFCSGFAVLGITLPMNGLRLIVVGIILIKGFIVPPLTK